MPDLGEYLQSLNADVLATAEANDAGTVQTFTERSLDLLEAAGVTDNTAYAHYHSRGAEIHGIGRNTEIGSLDLFVTDFDQVDMERRVTRRDIDARTARLLGFVRRCQGGLSAEIDETGDLYGLCREIEEALAEAPTIRLFVLTNAVARAVALGDGIEPTPRTLDDVPVGIEIWDAVRWQRLETSGTQSEPISVEFDQPLPCLQAADEDLDYHVLLSVIPGAVLADLYARYGTRLLELNVRSFLQARGAVNSGIRNTILNEPHRFLAYNNGITATASSVDFADGRPENGIKRLRDLQIVNGGQTTASLYHAATRDHGDLAGISVQAKINIVDEDQLDEVVPAISRYSNTQNKVSTVDLRANDRFHVSVEKMTRGLWAPATPASGGQETVWFYERARGQYTDALNRERTPARQRRFKTLHPARQKFTKSDLAKYENSWAGLPHLVSRGAEKNFREFMDRLEQQPVTINRTWCQHLIAKAIVFKEIERVVTGHHFGGYRANIVAYTVAKLVDATTGGLDLDAIWDAQQLSDDLRDAVDALCQPVFEVIQDPPSGITNIGEWCKREACWDRVQRIDWEPPISLLTARRRRTRPSESPDDSSAGEVSGAMKIRADTWFAIAAWARETDSLKLWQRSLAFSMGQLADQGRVPSAKQAHQALRLLGEAQRSGFMSQTNTA